jgi:hypothetical protein
MSSPSLPPADPPPAAAAPSARRVLAWRAGISAVLLAGIAGLVYLAVTGITGDRGRLRGDFTASSCTRASYHVRGSSYDCLGSFRGGDVSIPVLSLHSTGRLDRGERVGATVDSPDANTATPVSESRWRLIVTSAGALLLLVALISLWRQILRSRRT